MDSFINLAKQGYSAYQESQHVTGGQEYNSPDNSGQQGQGQGSPDIDQDEAVRAAASHHGTGGSSELFSNAMSFVSQNKNKHSEPVDEESVTQAHQTAYGDGDASGLSAHALGGAAALQALKKFTSGGQSAGSGSQTQIISLAMAEASKLFDQSGGAASGNKQDAVNGAAMTVMKLLVQSKFSGIIGGGNSGGLGGLMKLAQQFA